jgi:pimeloyl-ACP methyl ester carboxylesterase
MVEMLTRDLRPRLPAITAPALVLASWHGHPGETHDEVAQLFATQYATLRGAEVVLAEQARHFIMLDEPDFLYAQLDRFLARPER